MTKINYKIHESFHLLLEDLGYTMEPLDLAHLVSKLDSEGYGYITYSKIKILYKVIKT